MARNSHSPAASSSAAEPAMTTETFQKHYGRGTGYPDEHSHHHGHPPPPHHGYPPAHYGGPGQHPPPPPPHPGHHGHGGLPPPPPPPPPGYGHHHHHPSWYYPPHAAAAAAAPPDMVAASSRRSSSRASKKPSSMPIPLVTPKSHDSELPPAPMEVPSKISNKKSHAKPTGKKGSKRKDKSSAKAQAPEKEPEMEEEPKVEPMRQDFHFYAADKYEEYKQQCQKELDDALADGSISDKNKENQLFMLTTLLNNRLVKNWEDAPASTRQEYLKKEEADRKRFMSEEEVASRHCATLTARRRSPKQSGALGRAGSFGLVSTLEMPPTPVESSMKRPNSQLDDAEVLENAAKRVKTI